MLCILIHTLLGAVMHVHIMHMQVYIYMKAKLPSLEAYCMIERVLSDFSLQVRPLLFPVVFVQPQLAFGTVGG